MESPAHPESHGLGLEEPRRDAKRFVQRKSWAVLRESARRARMLRAAVRETPQVLSAPAAKGIPARCEKQRFCPPGQLEGTVRAAIPCAACQELALALGKAHLPAGPRAGGEGGQSRVPRPRVGGFVLNPTRLPWAVLLQDVPCPAQVLWLHL